MIDSHVLFVTICSNGKAEEPNANREYDLGTALQRDLPPNEGDRLMKTRRRAYSLLRNPETGRDGQPVTEHEYNRRLSNDGPDFGGGKGAIVYLPALERYHGRFYQALQETRGEQLRQPRHHLLIISGLYGLVSATESIQLYSLDVPDHPKITDLWRGERVLTRVLKAHVAEHQIARVFELCGVESYRRLVYWEDLGAEVLHAFGNRNAGSAVLPALGSAARKLLRDDEDELLTMPPEYKVNVGETVVFSTGRFPPEEYPWEGIRTEESGSRDGTPEGGRSGIRVTSGDDRTFFGHRVNGLLDVPAGARELLASVTWVEDVLIVRLAEFKGKGKTAHYSLKLRAPTKGSGKIEGVLRGPAKWGGTQEVTIGVKAGMEILAYQAIHRGNPEIELA